MPRRVHLFVATVTLVVVSTQAAGSPVDFKQCMANINKMNIDGKTDNHGRPLPPSTRNATAITYPLCVSQCGAGQEPFQWTVFSQQFSSWQIPWLALVSQLPFGANDKLENLESMLLTLGSPTLAAYSLGLTVLNGRWIAQLFSRYRYPNVQSAVLILNSLQQSPLRVDTDDAWLASLIILPQNDKWWTELAHWLNYTQTWSLSAVTSIAWVIIAYVFTIADYFSQGAQLQATLNTNGGSIGTLWLWLLPIVVGYLQFSPKCDSIRVNQAMDRANALAYVATSTSPPVEAGSISNDRAISIERPGLDGARCDEYSTPPIFNYARFLFWVEDVMVVFDTFQNVAERDHYHDPIFPGEQWRNRNPDDGNRLTAFHVKNYSLQRGESVLRPRWGLEYSGVASRMLIASALALMLQWGTTAAAVVIMYFTPTQGLDCRSVSYITYGMFSTLVWIMLLISSILTYYSTNARPHLCKGHCVHTIGPRVARSLSILLRRMAKVIAALNAVLIVAIGIMQFSSVYDICYCNSSVFSLAKRAYDVIIMIQDDTTSMRTGWFGGFSLAAGTAAIFAGVVSLFVDPPLPS